MRSFLHRLLVAFIIAAAVSCVDKRQMPTGPSAALPLASQTLDWDCGREAAAVTSGWTFPTVGRRVLPGRSSSRSAWASSAQPQETSAQRSPGPQSASNGPPLPSPSVSFRIEAGSATTLADLAILNTGNALTILTVTNVPGGLYYVRVRAVGTDGIPGPASNEITVRVGPGTCGSAPAAPLNLSNLVNGNQVALNWNPAAEGDAATTYIVEAGSTPGLSNVVVFDTGSATPALSAVAPNGTYYARVRGANACGVGAASNQVCVLVGAAGESAFLKPHRRHRHRHRHRRHRRHRRRKIRRRQIRQAPPANTMWRPASST